MIDQKLPKKEHAGAETEFFRAGKELPYKVPEGFFDAMPERTLLKAKARFETRKRQVLFTRSFVVFTVAAAILAFVFLLPNRSIKQEDRLVAMVKPMDNTPKTAVYSVKPTSRMAPEKIVSATKPTEISDEENLEDVLKSLSEKDLSDLLAEYRTDDFEEALSTETSNFN